MTDLGGNESHHPDCPASKWPCPWECEKWLVGSGADDLDAPQVPISDDAKIALRAIDALRQEHSCWFDYGPECEFYDLWVHHSDRDETST